MPASKKALGKAIKKRESLLNKRFPSIEENSISITIDKNSDNQKTDDNEIIDKNIKILNEQIDKIQKIQDRENLKIMTDRSDTIYLDIIKALDEENLKIHKYVQDIIHEKICIAVPPKELIDLFLQYDEHATVYQILRQMNIYDKFPAQYGTPYPQELRQKIEERITYLNLKRDKYSKKLG